MLEVVAKKNSILLHYNPSGEKPISYCLHCGRNLGTLLDKFIVETTQDRGLFCFSQILQCIEIWKEVESHCAYF